MKFLFRKTALGLDFNSRDSIRSFKKVITQQTCACPKSTIETLETREKGMKYVQKSQWCFGVFIVTSDVLHTFS